MAAAAPDDPMCCHFAIARNLSSKQLSPGVEARDKLLLEVIEEKQEKIFEKEGLAATDKGKKELKTVLGLVRSQVESCDQHGLVKLVVILTKNGGIIGGSIYIGGAAFSGFCFIVDKKKKEKKMAITVETKKPGSGGKWRKENPIGARLVEAMTYQGAQDFHFSVPLLCTSCQPRLKEARYQYFNSWEPMQ